MGVVGGQCPTCEASAELVGAARVLAVIYAAYNAVEQVADFGVGALFDEAVDAVARRVRLDLGGLHVSFDLDDIPGPIARPPTEFAPGSPAPDQVSPGVLRVEGWYQSPNRRLPEPFSAHYDAHGRITGRTDYTPQPDPRTHTDPHHHLYEYGPGYSPYREIGPLDGPHPLDQGHSVPGGRPE